MEKLNYHSEEIENNENELLEDGSPDLSDKTTDEIASDNEEVREFDIEKEEAARRALVEMIVENHSMPENIGELGPEEFKKELYREVIDNIDDLIAEWGLEPDQDLIELIRKTEDKEERSALELEYIKREHMKIDEITKNFKKSKSTRWDSWPKRMKETQEFNCVGATLLGISQLNRGGIRSYFGSPYGHAVNIARLSNDDWWYVDFRNGKRSMNKIEPEETFVDNIKVLKINNPNIAYRLIPIFDNSEIVGPIIGNLATLESEAKDPRVPDERMEKREAQAYLEKYKDNFQKIDFKAVQKSLFPNVANMEETEEMKREEERIFSLMDFEQPFQDYMKNLPREQRKAIIDEARTQKQKIEDMFSRGDDAILSEASPELKDVLEIFLRGLRDMKENQPEIYEENFDIIINRISNL
ncbi:MAG: hypothetical protein WC520_02405 [Candidatus Paceibacterota bacterium]